MSKADLITAHASQTFDNGPSGFLLSVAAEGFSHIDQLVLGKGDLSATTVTGGSVAALDRVGGGVRLTDGTSSNTASHLHSGKIFDTAKKFAVEVKLNKTIVSNTDGGVFVGVVAGSLGAAVPIAGNTGAHEAAANVIGFLIKDTDGDAVIPVNRGSGSAVEHPSIAISAATDVRLGFLYNPDDDVKLRYYVDGDLVAQDSDNCPASGTALQFSVSGKASNGSNDNTVDIDYVGLAGKV